MSATSGKGPVYDPGLCRCCGALKKCRVLNAEYISFGKKEVYSDMLMDCFGLLMSHLDSVPTDRLVCATCVHKIRDAFVFRQQVLKCEAAFLKVKMSDDSQEDKQLLEIKEEPLDNSMSRSPSPIDKSDEIPLSKIKMELPIKASVKKPAFKKPHKTLILKRDIQRSSVKVSKLPMTTLQQRIRENDPSYLQETNLSTIILYSYACPFKCRHNNILCYYCGEYFIDPAIMREHTICHNPKAFKLIDRGIATKLDLTRIDCRLCSTKIDTLEDFQDHITEVHKKIYYKNVSDYILPFRLLKEDTKCALCDKSFPYFHALNKHMNEHFRNYVCETCGLGFVDKNRFVMHQQRHLSGSFPCEVCGKVFKVESYKDIHVDRVHNKKGRVYCPKCDVILMNYPQKLKHLVEVHGEEPLSFPCSGCDLVFDTRRKFTIHRRKVHLKDFRYECQCCGQRFFTRSALTNHMPVHTGERNFKCKVCEKSYPRLKTLRDHIRIHTNDRRYRCHICGQAFIQNCSLKGHMKSQHPEYT